MMVDFRNVSNGSSRFISVLSSWPSLPEKSIVIGFNFYSLFCRPLLLGF